MKIKKKTVYESINGIEFDDMESALLEDKKVRIYEIISSKVYRGMDTEDFIDIIVNNFEELTSAMVTETADDQ